MACLSKLKSLGSLIDIAVRCKRYIGSMAVFSYIRVDRLCCLPLYLETTFSRPKKLNLHRPWVNSSQGGVPRKTFRSKHPDPRYRTIFTHKMCNGLHTRFQPALVKNT